MADSDYGSQLHSTLPIAPPPTPPALQRQNSNVLSPSYAHFGTFSGSELPGYNHLANSHRPHLPEPYSGYPHSYRPSQLPLNSGPRGPAYYPPAMPMFQQGSHAMSGLAPAAAAAHYHGLHTPGGPFPECPEPRVLPALGSSIHGGPPGFGAPPLQQWSSPPFPDFHRLSNSFVPNTPMIPGRYSGDSIRPVGDSRGPMRRTDSGAPDLPRHMTSPGRRPSHDRQFYLNAQASGGSERRPLSAVAASPTRRPNRSISPRTSNRRSFERYSTDLSQSENTDTNDAAQAPMHRVRRPRTIGFSSSYRARMLAHQDPNVPTPSQMQNLKDKLRHFLPSALPKDASTMCDICQKDYSAEHTDPTEEAEVAIMLPCKHIFGEHCINTWVGLSTLRSHSTRH